MITVGNQKCKLKLVSLFNSCKHVYADTLKLLLGIDIL